MAGGELKPCPFCGGEARKSGETFGNTILSWVYCTSCGAAGGYRHTEAEAIEAWNTRYEETCRNVGESMLFVCSECGCVVSNRTHTERVFEIPDYGDEYWADKRPLRYCSNCGRKVLEPHSNLLEPKVVEL